MSADVPIHSVSAQQLEPLGGVFASPLFPRASLFSPRAPPMGKKAMKKGRGKRARKNPRRSEASGAIPAEARPKRQRGTSSHADSPVRQESHAGSESDVPETRVDGAETLGTQAVGSAVLGTESSQVVETAQKKKRRKTEQQWEVGVLKTGQVHFRGHAA